MTELNFEEDQAIDLDDLHEEWRMHSSVRYKYAKEVSHWEKVVKKAHEKVKVARSNIIKEIKKDPVLSKALTSDSLREAHYRTHSDHKTAKDEHIAAEWELSMAWNALRAMDDRKFALENEVVLWKNNYFATPTERRDVEPGKRMMETAKDEVVKKGRQKVNAKRRTRQT